MANLGAYARTVKDILARKTSVKNAITVGKNTSGGFLKPSKGIKGVSDSKVKSSKTTAINNDEAPKDIYSAAPQGGGSSQNSDSQKVINSIGKGWDDTKDEIGSTEKSLKNTKNYISNLGKVRDKYVSALDDYKGKTDKAIEGNKALIEKNQKGSLDNLFGDTRKSVDNTNIMLGVKGASGGSASRMAAKAIARSAGKDRASILSGYGDEVSEQNLNASKAKEDYDTKREQAYSWEEETRKQAVQDFKEMEEALKRMKGKQGDWKEEDIVAESDKNLQKLLATLSNINMSAKNFRAELAAKYELYGGAADELEVAAVDVSAPSELDTPEFSENIDISDTGENQEDVFDPTKTGRRIKGYDPITGEPIYEDEETI